jgi:hypothetical protein
LELDYEQFTALFTRFDREAVHLEMRDSYGTAAELPYLARWADGEHDDLGWLRPWCDEVRATVSQGRTYRPTSAFEAVWKLAIPHVGYQPA